MEIQQPHDEGVESINGLVGMDAQGIVSKPDPIIDPTPVDTSLQADTAVAS